MIARLLQTSYVNWIDLCLGWGGEQACHCHAVLHACINMFNISTVDVFKWLLCDPDGFALLQVLGRPGSRLQLVTPPASSTSNSNRWKLSKVFNRLMKPAAATEPQVRREMTRLWWHRSEALQCSSWPTSALAL
jgi:hypothetical protein